MDNRTRAMTGGQHNASPGMYNDKDDMRINIKGLLENLGFNRVKEINKYKSKKLFKEEISYEGLDGARY